MHAKLKRAQRKGDPDKIAEIKDELAVPEFPRAAGYIWRAYLRIRRRKAMGFNGHDPIGWQDIDAFSRQTGLRLAPWEIELVEALDDAFLQPSAKPAPPVARGQDLVETASMDDGRAVHALMRSIGRRSALKKTKGGRSNG